MLREMTGMPLSCSRKAAWARVTAPTTIGAQSPQIQPLQVPGATPHEASARAHLVGTRPDGQSVEMALAVFADGTRVFQVTLLGRRASGDDAASFFASLRVAP